MLYQESIHRQALLPVTVLVSLSEIWAILSNPESHIFGLLHNENHGIPVVFLQHQIQGQKASPRKLNNVLTLSILGIGT
jgi:hypothetical protein